MTPKIREDFPILQEKIHGKPLVYFDNAATTQRPRSVLQAMDDFYLHSNANIHRGVHTLSERATEAFEGARSRVARYLNALPEEVIFVRGTTEGINLVAHAFGERFIGAGDEIILTELEHHSNIVPWQLLCGRVGATLKVVPVSPAGELDLGVYQELFSSRTKLLALSMVSNAIGTVNPVEEMIRVAHSRGVPVLLDAAQAVSHLSLDVRQLDCDFLAFSGHKVYGPTGIGVLYGRKSLLESLPPFQGGGDMIRSVSFAKTEYHEIPHRFEAGTPHIAGAIGLSAALDYMESIGLAAIARHEEQLLDRMVQLLLDIPGVRLIGTPARRAGVVSFELGSVHPHDLGTILDRHGVAIRAGHHCAQPLMDKLRVPGTARASVAVYNTFEEVDVLVEAVRRAADLFKVSER